MLRVGVDLGRTTRARHGLFVVICQALTECGAQYSLPAFSHDQRCVWFANSNYAVLLCACPRIEL